MDTSKKFIQNKVKQMEIKKQIEFEIFDLKQNLKRMQHTCRTLQILIPKSNLTELESILKTSEELKHEISEMLTELNEKSKKVQQKRKNLELTTPKPRQIGGIGIIVENDIGD